MWEHLLAAVCLTWVHVYVCMYTCAGQYMYMCVCICVVCSGHCMHVCAWLWVGVCLFSCA